MAIYRITSVGANKCLNIYGNNVTSLVNSQNVILYSDTGTNEQKWEISGLGSIMTIKSVINTDFALHADSSKNPCNCDVYQWKGGTGRDYVVNFVASGSNYKIQLANQTSLYLTATTSGTDVIWAAANNTNYQLWSAATTIVGGGTTVSATEREWLAALIFYESRGFNSYAKELVAQVVMNRVKSSQFPNSIEAVLKQSGQYGWPTSGMTATNIFENKWIVHAEYAANQAACRTAANKVADKTSVDENGTAWPSNVLYQHSFANPNTLGTGLFKTYTQGSYKLHFNFG